MNMGQGFDFLTGGLDSDQSQGNMWGDDLVFRTAPECMERRRAEWNGETQAWKIVLVPVSDHRQIVALEIRGDIYLGTSEQSCEGVDVNLAHLKGAEKNVSPRHVLIRPTPNKLFIMEVRASASTTINGLPLASGWAHPLKHGDMIALGRFQMRLNIVQRPLA
jgi:hypothetical protein